MKKIETPSVLEKFSGNVVTQITSTGLAAYIGTPLAALLPVLLGSLANGRHSRRVEKTLKEINEKLVKCEDEIKNLSDSQFKLINETILTILQTTEDEKIIYLKQVIENSIHEDAIPITLATQLSRIIRDISAEEIVFIKHNIKYNKVIFAEKTDQESCLCVKPNSNERSLAAGLISLGILVPAESTIGNIGVYQFSSLSRKLLNILNT
ncbi:MAG: hypothetical protein AB1333_04885 [Patescibacteria group bacterium]